MDDQQRPPTDRDREQVVARIDRAHDDGRIGTADRDIRLGNARSAQSRAELDLMNRDLDQLEASLPARSATAPPTVMPGPSSGGSAADLLVDEGVKVLTGARRIALALFLLVVLALVGAAALVVVGSRSSPDSGPSASPGVRSGATEGAVPADDPSADDPSTVTPAGSSYSLSGSGIRDFLSTYRKKFGTSRVVDLTFYGDYVIVDVPVPGHARQEGWLYRGGTWTGFGGVRATFPGARVVDTDRLDVPALVRNVARAKRTLHVEQPQAYVVVRFITGVDTVPSVDVHVTNKFQESGYLATRLDGTVERAYVYDR